MRKFSLMMVWLAVLAIVLAACGGESNSDSDAAAAEVVGDATKGESLYKQKLIGETNAAGCITCHSLEEGKVLVGPSHAGIGKLAAGAVAGMSADEYLKQSIIAPNAHITDGYSPGSMYQFYGQDLTEQEIADLVAFLKTQ